MKHKILLIVGLLLFGGVVAYCNTDLYPVNVSISVVDEAGHPVEGAHVVMTTIKSAKAWETSVGENTEGNTGKDGKFSVLVRTMTTVSGDAQKKGYYGKSFERIDYPTEANKAGIPYGLPVSVERTIVLRKVLNPESLVSMRLKDYFINASEEKMGFDLELGDWVSPHGKGEKTDFYLQRNGYFRGDVNYDYQFVLSFPNEGDGIVAFNANTDEWRFAPENGYKSVLEWRYVRKINDESREEITGLKQDYFLRVRTELDENGKISKANYARIQRMSEILPAIMKDDNTSLLRLSYRFNPRVNSRSLERGGE